MKENRVALLSGKWVTNRYTILVDSLTAAHSVYTYMITVGCRFIFNQSFH